MKIICTTVIRAAKQGDIHGGLYVIDTDKEEVIYHAPYEIKRTHQDNDYFKSVHEITFHDNHIWATSTAHDAIVKVDLDFNVKGFWKMLGRDVLAVKNLTGKEEITPETEDDHYHINSISTHDGRLSVAGLLTPLYDFETMDEICEVPVVAYRNSFVHNFYEYENGFITNLTTLNSVGVFPNPQGSSFGWGSIDIPRSRNVTYKMDDIAVNNWNRGLAIKDGKIIIGSSPARILIYDIETKEFEKEIQLEKDVRHAIHGLEILE